MTFINGLLILMLCQLVGEIVVIICQLPVSGPILGMFILFTILVIKGGANKSLSQTSHILISHLSLLFIPAGVGIIAYLELFKSNWVGVIIVITMSTCITLICTAWTMQLVMKKNPDK